MIYRYEKLFAALAITALLCFNFLLPHAVPITNKNPEGLEIMIGLMSMGTIFVALYFYNDQLGTFRQGMQDTNRFLKRITNINPHFEPHA